MGKRVQARALLFDMDGTLLDSSEVIEKIWRGWAAIYNVDAEELLSQAHGRRAIETVRRFAPSGIDAVKEADALNRQAAEETVGIVAISGAQSLLQELMPQEWAIVTSAQRALAERWLKMAKLPQPTIMICAEDVGASKPSPEGYILAGQLLKCELSDAFIFEDAEAGFVAAREAGATVIGVGVSTHLSHLADKWILDYQAVKIDRSHSLQIEFE